MTGLLGKTVITQAISQLPKASIFFLHGTCDSGQGLRNWIGQILHQEFQFRNYRVIYPSSPIRPYGLLNGQDAAVWFDKLSLGPELPEDRLGIDSVGKELTKLIHEEREISGIPMSKIILGGFSMGGSMALHLGFKLNPEVAGVFALSSFLPPDSSVYTSLDEFTRENPQFEPDDTARNVTDNGHIIDRPISAISENKLPKLFMSHGEKDPLVKSRWCKSTFDQLRSYGTEGHFFTFPKQNHEITRTQLNLLHNWIDEVLTDTPKPKITERKPYHLNDNSSIPAPWW